MADFCQLFGKGRFKLCGQTENGAIFSLLCHRALNGRVLIAQYHTAKRGREVDILVPVDIPDPRALPAHQGVGRDAFDELVGRFGERLRGAWDHLTRALEECFVFL
jgi:hypothetical protein